MTPSILSNETPMGSLPDGRATCASGAVALLVTPGPPPVPGLAAGFHAGMAVRTCFCGARKSSMVVEMPLDNRTVNKFAAPPLPLAFSGLSRAAFHRHD